LILERARLLLEQGRYKDAEKEIKTALVSSPENDDAYGLLARVYLDTNQAELALQTVAEALRIEPGEGYYLYLKAFAEYKLDQLDLAQTTLQDAIENNPYNASYFALYSYLLLDKNDFAGALERANEGLALDPEDIGCLNGRARALNKLGRTSDAISTMQDSLAADPENDFTHTNIGWNLLEKGQHKQAIIHFKESLRLNPGSQSARDGMKEALKSKIAPYRWFLMYGMWLGNQKQGFRIGLAIGLYLCFRVVSALGKQLQPPLSYIALTLVAFYVLAVLISWLILPIANFFLLFHPQGKYALTSSEKINSKTVVGALLAGFCLFIISMFLQGPISGQLMLTAVIIASLAFPFSYVKYPVGKSASSSKTALVIAGIGILTAILLVTATEIGSLLLIGYFVALIGSSWIIAFRR
jgi:tetratricopeptide (TPR) repeat protein